MLRFLGSAQQPLLGLAERMMSNQKPPIKPVQLPQGFEAMPATSEAQLDAIVGALRAKAPQWSACPPRERAALLRACLPTSLAVAEEAAEAATRAKGSYGQGLGEDLTIWVPVVLGLRELAEALEAPVPGAPRPVGMRRRLAAAAPGQPSQQQLVVDVWPQGAEALLWGGFKGEVWLQPGQEATQGALYRRCAVAAGDGGVALVLGAGNQLPVVALDILHKLVMDNEVVVCKMNPVNEYLGPYIRRAFQPLVAAGYLEVVYGGGAVGQYLCRHDGIASVHLTGSATTYDAIVWRGQPKTAGAEPPFKKPVGAELGCVTPYIVVPGPWSDADIEYHADSAELVVTDRGWALRDKFLAALRAKLRALPPRVAYYPGSHEKHAAFLAKFPAAERLGTPGGSGVEADGDRPEVKPTAWLLQAGLSPDEASTQDENWCGVIQEVCLDCGGDPARFMLAAQDFANDRCWGTLSCAVFVHPATQRQHQSAFDSLVAGLRYGTVVINGPTLLGFAITKMGWGAWNAGGTPQNIGSGNCFVHNTAMYDHLQKSVLYAPWRFAPTAFWSPSNRNLEAVGHGALKFTAQPSLLNALPLAWQALKG